MAEDVLGRFVEMVRQHYSAAEAPPLLLSSFGHSHATLLAELKARYGTLKEAIRAAGEDRLRIVDRTAGRESFAPSDIASEVERRIKEDTAARTDNVTNFDSLPLSVRLAFCVRTEADEHVALDLAPPFHFVRVRAPDLIRSGQRIIPDAFRKPGLSLSKASLPDRQALWRSFLAWAQDAGVDPGIFKSERRTNALSRLISAQRPEVIERLVIPADIAALLLQHP
jgi:hypothetical protein